METSQDWKIAALTIKLMCTFIFGVNMNEKYMNLAIKEAKKSFKKDEVPVGCIIVKKNKIIAKAHNLKEKKKSVLYHAELIAISKASKKIKNWRLNDCKIYITLEPCLMCYNALKAARIEKIYYAVERKEQHKNKLNTIKYDNQIIEQQSKNMIQKFFKNKRK